MRKQPALDFLTKIIIADYTPFVKRFTRKARFFRAFFCFYRKSCSAYSIKIRSKAAAQEVSSILRAHAWARRKSAALGLAANCRGLFNLSLRSYCGGRGFATSSAKQGGRSAPDLKSPQRGLYFFLATRSERAYNMVTLRSEWLSLCCTS